MNATFYDRWLAAWDDAVAARRDARKVTHEADIDWVTTVQDHRVGLLIAPEIGFRTWGSETLVAEIPAGHHTGRHRHGEEAIHIVEGRGFSVVDGIRFEWRTGSTLLMPFGAEHQHFNTGPRAARYLSAVSVHLEMLCGIHRTTQLAERDEIRELPSVPVSPDGLDRQGRRIHLALADAPIRLGDEDGLVRPSRTARATDGAPAVVAGIDGYGRAGVPVDAQHAQVTTLMRVGRPLNAFRALEQEISSILTDPPGERTGSHAHMEAHLYVLSGSGYSLVDDERIEWQPGTAIHIQGPQTVHRHVNTGPDPSRMLRIAPGIRYFFERMARDEFPYLFFEPRSGYTVAETSGSVP